MVSIFSDSSKRDRFLRLFSGSITDSDVAEFDENMFTGDVGFGETITFVPENSDLKFPNVSFCFEIHLPGIGVCIRDNGVTRTQRMFRSRVLEVLLITM